MADARVELTLARGIRTAAARWPERPAVIAGKSELRYRQLVQLMAKAGHAVLGLGLVPGDRVALVSGNRIDYVGLVAGLADVGIIVATLGSKLTQRELAQVVGDCAPRLILADGTNELARTVARDAGIRFAALDGDWADLLDVASDVSVIRNVRETDSFALSYTSGTTGAAKGVMLTHRSRALTFLAMASEYGCFSPNDRFLVITPMSHGAGFVFAAAPLFFGGTAILLETGDPEIIADRLAEPDISGMFTVPTQIARLGQLEPGRLRAGERLKALISNASALRQPLKEMMIERLGSGLLHETYGSTEAGIVTNIRPEELLMKPNSVGTPFPLIEVLLRNEVGGEVAAGDVGELLVRGPYAFAGYWNLPGPSAEACVDGWVTVGDLARRDNDGFLTIVDRKQDMVVTGGINVYPREIEIVLSELPGVFDVAVVGVPDLEWGERLQAFVVGTASSEELNKHARAQLAPHKLPKRYDFVTTIPRGPTGKILKRTLRETAMAAGPNDDYA